MIKIQNLNFGYNQSHRIIHDFNLDVEKNTIVSVVGVSGCGKSTLLRLISGLLIENKKHLYTGTISIDQHSSIDYRKEGKLSFMFQEHALLPNKSVYENIALPFRIHKAKNNFKEINDIIETVGLSTFKNYLPSALSGGMKTRVSLARSFITQPELLLLDEPFSALDVAWKEEIYQELKTLQNKYSTTVLLVTHDINEALRLSNEVYVMGIQGGIIKKFFIDKNKSQALYNEIHQTIISDHKTHYN